MPLGNRDVMATRLAGWMAAPPSMAKVQPYRLDDMLNKTLHLYQQLAAAAR